MDSSTPHDDASLVAASRRGDVVAFGQLIERYHNLVCAIAYSRTGNRCVSEDIAQDTFITAWRDIRDLRDADKLRPWLCGIARNLAGKSLRNRRPTVDADDLEGELAGDPGPLIAMLTKEREATVWAALEQLPPTYREPLILFYREQQSIKEVARGLGLSEETAKQRLSRGRTSLKANMGELVEQTLQAGRPRKAAAAAVLAAILATRGTTTALAATNTTALAAKAAANPRRWLVAGGALAIVAAVVVVGSVVRKPDARPAGDAIAELHRARAAWQATSGGARSCALRGAVTRTDGAPIAGAIVAAMEHSWQSPTLDPLIVETDAGGHWQMPLLGVGTYTVSVSAPGQRAESRIVTCSATQDLALQLRTGGTALRGSVSDAGGGAVAAVTVIVVDPQRTTDIFVTRTTTDGSYELLLAPARYMIMATHPEYTLDVRPITLATARREDFTLLPGASIEGTVVDASGTPVAGAKVATLMPAASQPGLMTFVSNALVPTTADASGAFRLRGLAPGALALVARSGDNATAQPTELALSLAETKSGVTVRVARAHKISGFVVGDGHGVAAAQVIAFRDGTPIAAPITTTSDGAGYFELAGLLPARYRIAAISAGYAPYVTEQPLTIDRDITDHVVTLQRGVALRGQVEPGAFVKLEPAPNAATVNAYVNAALSRAVVDDRGRFTFAAVAPGDYMLTATTFGARGTTPLHVTGDQTGLRVELEPTATITGHVVDTAGKPIAGVLVAATGDPLAALYTNARTDDAGAFTIVGVAGGTSRLRVFDRHGQRPFATDKQPYTAQRVKVAAHGQASAELVVASGGQRLTGVVLDPNHEPIADAWIEVRARDALPAPELFRVPPAQTDANGRFAIDGLFGSELIVDAAGPDRKLRAVAIAKPGSSLQLQLRPTVTFTPIVTHAGKPVAKFDAKLTSMQTQQSQRGTAALEVVPGEYELVLTADAGYAKQRITLDATITKPIELSAWASLRGRVVAASGEPWSRASILLREELEPTRTKTNANGEFTIDKVLAGHNTLDVMPATASDEFITMEFDIAAGQQLDLGIIQPRDILLARQTTASSSRDLGMQFFVSVAPPTAAQLAAVTRDPLAASREGSDPKAVLWIAKIEPSSIADRAGFKAGDRITAVGLSKVDKPVDMLMSLSQPWRSRGRTVPWVVVRDGRELRIDVRMP